ncbi:MAG TPA: hypothetical protein HA349_03250, partial [Methanotrichaceae archaeon]|nr:hypothetical protein [Methanotrichaceae archaeon]
MDATGLWFSKLQRNFFADYGQFRWTDEQRTWDWNNLTTVDLVRTRDGTKRLVLRRKEEIHTENGRPDIRKEGGYDANLRYMLGINIDAEPGDIECDYYTARVYDHYKNRWNLIGPKKRLSFQIGDKAWLWQWADEKCEPTSNTETSTEETKIGGIHKYIKDTISSDALVYTNIFNLDVGAHHECSPIIYQPAVDGMKNFIREIHCSTKHETNGKKEVEVTLVFNNEELRKHKILNKMYERIRLAKYGRLRDIESFVIMADSDDNNVNGLCFTKIYSGKNDLEEDTIHGDPEGDLPPHRVKYYANDYKHPIIFVNTSNHSMAEHDTNPDLWKWEYAPWVDEKPFISGKKSREEVNKPYFELNTPQ